MSQLPSVELITPCRNRVEYLRDSLPSWLACPQLQQIIVVDFNSTTPVIEELGDLSSERVTVVRVEDESLWRQGRAQNIGLGLAEADLVLKTDADVATVNIRPYVERMADEPGIFFKGYCKMGTSSGLCLAPRHLMKAAGGYHDHMSGWGGDDVDFYRRLKKRKLKPLLFQPESFREQGQKMAGKNSEAPRLDSELIADPQQLARQPFFSGFRNTLLARIQRQNKRLALRWRYNPVEGSPNLLIARLRASSHWRLQVARHSVELANILAVTHYQQTESVWELMRSKTFEDILEQYQLPRWQNRKERERLLSSIPERKKQLCKLATSLGVPLLSENNFSRALS
ncbi:MULTISPECIES: glycosyltransferase family 2 protein [unclassified Cyanobium]|uniref:glycosyltransferase family 2 protein n=1 Tax=unclassified Cyanobium TaxID=2627006 RepID=UPI0020CE80D9|nr:MULTISPECIES: glycosyltransferase family A protein [unclassified Cyanobium]MCP9778605.1 glycosyltransferase family 2 protein [Cyanobium sp. Tous-M-B4]MCP9876237.1 glycosyltransferase family 2 protein [Cyanobium sp. A2C-AMD]